MRNVVKILLAAALSLSCLAVFGCSSPASEETMLSEASEPSLLGLATDSVDDPKATKDYWVGKYVKVKAFATSVDGDCMKSSVQPKGGLVTFEIRFANKDDLADVKPSSYSNIVGEVESVSDNGKVIKIKDAYLLP